MYKLMIVEDEPIEREALSLMVQNSCDNINLVAAADNGFAAIEKFKKFQPDIVMIDINMPGMNGLDTIKELQKINKKAKYLILSSYDRFEYAQEAIQLGVEDFILKPAKIARLQKAFDDIIIKLNQEEEDLGRNTVLLNRMEVIRPVIENDCIYGILSNRTEAELKKMFSFLGFNVGSGFCFVVVSKGNYKFILGEIKKALGEVGLRCIGQQSHDMLVYFILDDKTLEAESTYQVGNFVSMLLKESTSAQSFVGVGSIFEKVVDLNLSYKQAVKTVEFCVKKNQGMCVYSEDIENANDSAVNIAERAADIASAILDGDNGAVENIISFTVRDLIFNQKSLRFAKEQIYRLFILVENEIKGSIQAISFQNDFTTSMRYISNISGGRELEQYIKTRIDKVMAVTNKNKQINSNLTINLALEYINKNYNKDISLDKVAERLDITPFYLSRLLKRHTGKNFTDIVAEKRISLAKELLRKNKSIKEVSFDTGFNSQNYFTKTFKKYVGITPTKYKSHL